MKRSILISLFFIVISAIVIFWSWDKSNWWYILGIPFSLFFFSNKVVVRSNLGYVLTFVLVHIFITFVDGHFLFTVWSWFYFLIGFISCCSACIIFGTEESNWKKQAELMGDIRSFEEKEMDEFLNSKEIKGMTEKIIESHKNNNISHKE